MFNINYSLFDILQAVNLNGDDNLLKIDIYAEEHDSKHFKSLAGVLQIFAVYGLSLSQMNFELLLQYPNIYELYEKLSQTPSQKIGLLKDIIGMLQKSEIWVTPENLMVLLQHTNLLGVCRAIAQLRLQELCVEDIVAQVVSSEIFCSMIDYMYDKSLLTEENINLILIKEFFECFRTVEIFNLSRDYYLNRFFFLGAEHISGLASVIDSLDQRKFISQDSLTLLFNIDKTELDGLEDISALIDLLSDQEILTEQRVTLILSHPESSIKVMRQLRNEYSEEELNRMEYSEPGELPAEKIEALFASFNRVIMVVDFDVEQHGMLLDTAVNRLDSADRSKLESMISLEYIQEQEVVLLTETADLEDRGSILSIVDKRHPTTRNLLEFIVAIPEEELESRLAQKSSQTLLFSANHLDDMASANDDVPHAPAVGPSFRR